MKKITKKFPHIVQPGTKFTKFLFEKQQIVFPYKTSLLMMFYHAYSGDNKLLKSDPLQQENMIKVKR